MVFAQISNQLIVNTIILSDESMLNLFLNDQFGNPFDYVLRIDMIYPQPGIGWTFDGIQFYPPPTPPDDDGGS